MQVNLRTTLLCHMPEPPEILYQRELPSPKAMKTLMRKVLFSGFQFKCIFRQYGVPPAEALHTYPHLQCIWV